MGFAFDSVTLGSKPRSSLGTDFFTCGAVDGDEHILLHKSQFKENRVDRSPLKKERNGNF